MKIGEQLMDLERRETFADWYTRTWLDDKPDAYLVKLTERADRYAVVHVSTVGGCWDVSAGIVDLARASYVDVRRAMGFSCERENLELTNEPGAATENEIAMLLFAEDPERWGTVRWSGHATDEALVPIVARAVERILPSAPLEVCPRCLERTGGIVEPGTGRCFALELKRDLRVGGMTWEKNSNSPDPGLCDVLRSDCAPHHLVAYYGDTPPPRPCSPICLLPADAIEVWTVDHGSDGDE